MKLTNKLKRGCAIVLSTAMLFSNLNVSAFNDTTILDENEPIIKTEPTVSGNDIIEAESIQTESTETTVEELTKHTSLEETAISSETEVATIEITSLDEFTEEVTSLSESDDLEIDSIFATKRLLVLSNTSEFDNYGAESIIAYDNLYILSYETESICETAYNNLLNDENILSVEVDSIIETESNNFVLTNTTNSKMQNTELENFLNSLEYSKEVKVAVLDTGIDTTQFDTNKIIDLEVNLSSSGNENSITDDNGHGTEMASIIVSSANDYVKLMPVKIANAEGKATILNTYLGLKLAMENDADVINISMNTIASSQSQILTSIIDEATSQGIIVVVSAGNNSMDTNNITPANIENAIVVSAINDDNTFATYSNYGKTIDYCSYGTYNNKTGTSYATANVTRIIADLLSKNESSSSLSRYAIDLGTEGFDAYFGNGFIGTLFNDSESVSDEIPSDYFENTIFNTDWKSLSDEELNECLTDSEEVHIAIWLQSLSKEDLDLVLRKKTLLTDNYISYGYALDENGEKIVDETSADEDGQEHPSYKLEEISSIPYYEYLLNIDFSEMSISSFTALNGYYTLQIRGGGQSNSSIRIKTSINSLDNLSSQTVTYSIVSGSTTNNHGFKLTSSSGDTKKASTPNAAYSDGASYEKEDSTIIYRSSHYDVAIVKGSYTQPAYTYPYGTTETSGNDCRLNFKKYSWQNDKENTINTRGVYKSDKTHEFTMSVNLGNSGHWGTETHGVLRIQLKYPTLTINYKPNGATSGSITASKTITYGSSDNLHNFSTFSLAKTGYSKKDGGEWNTKTNGSGTGFDEDVDYAATTYKDFDAGERFTSKSMTVYAQWTANPTTPTVTTYTVAFDLNGGTARDGYDYSTRTVAYDTAINVGDPYRTGYVFAGWTLNGWYTCAEVTTNSTYAGMVTTLIGDGNGNYPYYLDDPNYINFWIKNLRSEAGTVTLTAQWKPITYTVEFNLNGGTGRTGYDYSTRTVSYDENINLGDPTREGYTFAGWRLNNWHSDTAYLNNSGWYGLIWDLFITDDGLYYETFIDDPNYINVWLKNLRCSSGTVTITAMWTPNEYTVAFDLNGGTGRSGYDYSTRTIEYEEQINVGDPTKTGYTFAGWKLTNSNQDTAYSTLSGFSGYLKDLFGDNYIDSSDYINIWLKNLRTTSGTVTFTAQWTPNTYNLTINPNGGTMYSNNSTKTTSAFTVKFQYGANRHLGTFDNTYYGYSSTVGLPTRTGYTFAGWKVTSGGGTVNYYSTPTNNPYGYKTDDFTQNTGKPTSWAYYLFDGNYAGNVTITAQWTPNTNTKYVVNHYQMNVSGSGYTLKDTESKTGTTADTLTLSTLKKTYTGFTYEGGKGTTAATATKPSSLDTTTTILADGTRVINLYYARNKYTVTLNKGTGISGVTGAGTYYYGASVTINATVSTGYTWSKWSGTHNTTTQKYTFTMPASTVTDTASATPNTYNLTINPNGGTMYSNNSTKTTSAFTVKFQYGANRHLGTFDSTYYGYSSTVGLPTRTGYTFAGWKVTSGGGIVNYYSTPTNNPYGYKTDDFTQDMNRPNSWAYYLFNGNYAGNVTITAQWTINSSTLNVNPNGGTWNGFTTTQSYTQNYNTTKSIPVPTMTNYKATFNGNGGTSTSSSISTNKAFSKWTRTNTYGTVSSLTDAATYKFGSTNNVTDTITANYSGSYTITLPSASRTGYTFNGWYTAASGGTKIGNAGATVTLSSNATYYAHWTAIQYPVTYIDVIESTSGKELGRITKQVDYGTTVKGSDRGSNTSDNAYYTGYYYDSCTSATVTTNGATVYRIFKLRTQTINGNIIWDDWNNKNLSRPDNVTLHIIGSDGNTYDCIISGNNAQNTSINKWSYSKEVPKYNSNAVIITYTVVQDKAISKEEGISYKEPIVNGYDATNKASSNPDEVPVLPEINVTTSINWMDNNNEYDYRPNEITIQLLQNGVVINEVTTSKTSYIFDKLYKYDEDGNLYKYTINSNEIDRYTLSLDNERPYKKVITYTFQAPTFSVTIPKTVILDGQTGIGEYTVSVQGNIDDRDSIKVIPDNSFTMRNDFLSDITATIKQTLTSFTNKNNVKGGTTTKGTITTKSLAGEWYGSFNFNIYFEFGK